MSVPLVPKDCTVKEKTQSIIVKGGEIWQLRYEESHH